MMTEYLSNATGWLVRTYHGANRVDPQPDHSRTWHTTDGGMLVRTVQGDDVVYMFDHTEMVNRGLVV